MRGSSSKLTQHGSFVRLWTKDGHSVCTGTRRAENSVTWLKLLETQPVHCVHTPEISCESCGGNTYPNVSEDANFLICSTYCFLGAGAGEAAKVIQHVRVVHVFNVRLRKGNEGFKLCENGCLRAFLFAFDVSIALVCLSEFCFRVRYFLYMSVPHVLSVPPFLRKLCSFRFHHVLSFQTLSFRLDRVFCFQFFPCSFQPGSFRLNPALVSTVPLLS